MIYVQVNTPTGHPSSSSYPPAAEAGRRSQSAAPPGVDDNEYLVPRQNHAQPKYLDFPDGSPVLGPGNWLCFVCMYMYFII